MSRFVIDDMVGDLADVLTGKLEPYDEHQIDVGLNWKEIYVRHLSGRVFKLTVEELPKDATY